MTLNDAHHTMTRTALQLHLFLFAVAAFFLNPRPTQAIGYAARTPFNSADFSTSVQNDEVDVLRGVYVPNVMELPVIQQPPDDPYYVSNRNGEATQFSMASHYGNIGLLAHNTLSGEQFSQLEIGQEIRLVYGNGRVEYFVVQQILRFQALEPDSVSSVFRNLDRDETLSAGELFSRAYAGERHLVFQTCIEANGNVSWGRLFVIALPKG
jgi:hypothetical protein